MSLIFYTWGTGAAYGRELGLSFTRRMRNQTANSIIGFNHKKIDFHFLVDAGSPCVESIIQKNILKVPDALFITHSHNDHISDLDKLVHSRIRGLDIQSIPLKPLPIICTEKCLNHPEYGLKEKFKDYNDEIDWKPITSFDEWHSLNKSNGNIIPSNQIKSHEDFYKMEFKALPVNHSPDAPGACLYIFHEKTTHKKLIISGDFHSLNDNIINNKDFKDPSLIILETNNIKAWEEDHTNWENNKKLIKNLKTDKNKTLVLISHTSGYEDYKQGYYDRIPIDKDWVEEIENFNAPYNITVELAKDGKRYKI